MTKTITIDDIVLKGFVNMAKDSYSEILSDLESTIYRKSNGSSGSLSNTIRHCLNTALLFVGSYNATLRELNQQRVFEEDVMNKSYFAKLCSLYAASESVLKFLDVNPVSDESAGGTIQQSRYMPKVPSIDLRKEDYNMLAQILEGLVENVHGSYDMNFLKFDFGNYFSKIASQATQEAKKRKNLYSKAKNMTIRINNSEIPLFVERKSKAKKSNQNDEVKDPNEMFKKPLEQVAFDPIERSQIKLPNFVLSPLEQAVTQMFMYDFNEKKNPYLEDGGFVQRFFLYGLPGVGKSLTARYVLSLAQRLAKKSGVKVSFPQLDFENSFQYGPIVAFKHMATEITKGDKLHIIWIDELDTKFPSRLNQNKSVYHAEVLGEMNRWLDGTYQNRGNYLLVTTGNTPGDLDPSLVRRVHPIYLIPPTKPEDFAEILNIHLKTGIEAGYVDINAISHGREALKLGLTPADCAEVCEELITASRTYKFSGSILQSPYAAKLAQIRKNHRKITDGIMGDGLYRKYQSKQDMKTADIAFRNMGARSSAAAGD